eukprot:3853192-Rhodomonas_salina.1
MRAALSSGSRSDWVPYVHPCRPLQYMVLASVHGRHRKRPRRTCSGTCRRLRQMCSQSRLQHIMSSRSRSRRLHMGRETVRTVSNGVKGSAVLLCRTAASAGSPTQALEDRSDFDTSNVGQNNQLGTVGTQARGVVILVDPVVHPRWQAQSFHRAQTSPAGFARKSSTLSLAPVRKYSRSQSSTVPVAVEYAGSQSRSHMSGREGRASEQACPEPSVVRRRWCSSPSPSTSSHSPSRSSESSRASICPSPHALSSISRQDSRGVGGGGAGALCSESSGMESSMTLAAVLDESPVPVKTRARSLRKLVRRRRASRGGSPGVRQRLEGRISVAGEQSPDALDVMNSWERRCR